MFSLATAIVRLTANATGNRRSAGHDDLLSLSKAELEIRGLDRDGLTRALISAAGAR